MIQGKTTGSETIFDRKAAFDFLIDSFRVPKKHALAIMQESQDAEDFLLVVRMVDWIGTNWNSTINYIEFQMNCSCGTNELVRQMIVEFCEGARARAESSTCNLEEVNDFLGKKGLSPITEDVGELPRAVRKISILVSYFPIPLPLQK